MSSVLRDDRTVGQLFSDLVAETRTLIRQEIDLAKTEVGEKAALVGRNAGMMAAGGLVAYVGLLTLVAAVTIGLGHVIGYGFAALLLGLVITLGGVGLILEGRKRLQAEPLAPVKTKAELKEVKQWAKEQMK